MDHFNQKSFLLIAHRGGLSYRPENTFAAFEHCIESSIEWVECDVRISQDGIPVIIHDDRLSSTNGRKLAVRDLTREQLRSIDAGQGEEIPSLVDAVGRFKDSLNFDLEIKEIDAVEKSIEIIKKQGAVNRVIITSFIPDVLQMARELSPGIPRGLLIDRIAGRLAGGKSAVNAARLLDCQYFLPHVNRVNRSWSRSAHKAGLKVIPWTVNSEPEMEKVLECEVDGLISDNPNDLRTKLQSLKIMNKGEKTQ